MQLPGYRVAIAVKSLEQERNMFQKLHMGRAAGAHAIRSARNAEKNGKVRQGMPDFLYSAARVGRAFS